MSRIRSVHPGLFTDEAFAGCSPLARLFWIGIWTEADDQGIFEWKPFGLRMRLLPGDKVDADPLLDELIAADMVKRFAHAGREYGAIRNFGRFQRPKKAKKVHPVPHELRTYVALNEEKSEPNDDEATTVPPKDHPKRPSTPSSSPPVPPSAPTSGEKPIQREEEGGRREEENLEAQRMKPASRRLEFDKIEQSCREALGEIAPDDHVIGPMVRLVDQGIPLNTIVSVLISEARRKRSKPIRTWKIWGDIVVEKIAESPNARPKLNGAPPPDALDPAESTRPVDMGSGLVLEEKTLVKMIRSTFDLEMPNRAAFYNFMLKDFDKVEIFRRGIEIKAPHLLKFWPAEPALAAAK